MKISDWLAGQKGTVSTLPSLPPADIEVDFGYKKNDKAYEFIFKF